ncbi:MAG: sensor histidine kinase [Verrucomicrobiota bacterium]
MSFRSHLVPLALFGVGLAQAAALPEAASSTGTRLFTNTHSIRQITPEEAKRAHPVSVRAVVIAHSIRYGYFVQDETGPIFVRTTATSEDLRMGQILLIEGVTDPGRYAPQIKETKRTIVGRGVLPPARRLTYEQLVSGTEDCQYAEIEGVVRRADVLVTGSPFRALALAMGEGRVEVSIYDPEVSDSSHLVDARVRLRGVVSGRYNEKRQWMGVRFNVSSLSNLTVLRPAPPHPFEGPLRPIQTLLQWDPGQSGGHRVKVQGVVTHFRRGEALYLREHLLGLQVLTKEVLDVQPGDVVEVLGFPALGVYSSVLEDAVFRRAGRASEPTPLEATPTQLLDGALDAGLVAVRGTLLESVRRHGVRTMVVQAEDEVFTAQVDQLAANDLLDHLAPGSLLQLTGICAIREITTDGARLRPKTFALLMRSPADVTILRQPSWWTAARLMQALGIVSFAALAISGWVWLLHRRVREQTRIIEHKVQREAVNEERTRIAQEFHDTLEQELAGICLQLKVAAAQVQNPPVSHQLELVHRLLQRSQDEVRRAVWDLRRPAEPGGLAAALTEATGQLRNGGAVSLDFNVTGLPRRLPAVNEHQLLRVAVEAVTNAFKHARARRIRVELAYEPDVVRLRVEDDGCGFIAEQVPSYDAGHFGLVGMRERAKKIGAGFELRSAPGRGTRIEISLADNATRAKVSPVSIP